MFFLKVLRHIKSIFDTQIALIYLFNPRQWVKWNSATEEWTCNLVLLTVRTSQSLETIFTEPRLATTFFKANSPCFLMPLSYFRLFAGILLFFLTVMDFPSIWRHLGWNSEMQFDHHALVEFLMSSNRPDEPLLAWRTIF